MPLRRSGIKELACGGQAPIATSLFDPSMSALPIIVKHNSQRVGLGHVDKVVPDELEKGLHAEFQTDALGDGLDELGYQILPAFADLHD